MIQALRGHFRTKSDVRKTVMANKISYVSIFYCAYTTLLGVIRTGPFENNFKLRHKPAFSDFKSKRISDVPDFRGSENFFFTSIGLREQKSFGTAAHPFNLPAAVGSDSPAR